MESGYFTDENNFVWKERIYRVSIVIRIATKQLKLRIGEHRGKIKEKYS